MGEPIGRVAGLTVGFFDLELVNELDGGEAPDPQVMMHDGLDADGGGEMCLARPRSADKDNIVGVLDEVAAVQGFDEGHVDSAVLELEA